MYYILKIIVISIAIFTYTVYSNNNFNDNHNDHNHNNHDNHNEDHVINNIDNELNENQNDMSNVLDEKDKEAMDELFNSGLFKFLEDIDDDAIMEGKEQHIGKANENTYCYVKDEDPYHLFSTKTHYPAHNDSSHLDPAPGCEVVYVWMVMRHGIRYGSRTKTYEYYHLGKIRDEIVTHAGQKKTELCMDDLFNFLLWMPILPGQKPIEPETLTENGYEMVKNMAKLLKEKFPHLIPNKYNPNKMKIDFSDEIKVNKTVEALTEELFGKPFVPPVDLDGVLEKVYQDNCRRPATLDRETHMNYTYLTQNSDYVNKMIDQITVKLGYDDRLTYRDVSKMYDGCQYEIAWGHDRSPWCAVFTKDHLKIMEYISDISYYYFCGPGDVYNYFQGCILLKDLIENLVESAKNEKREKKMTLLLGHSTTVLLLITQLGLVDDPQLTHKNYFELADRKWRTSFLAPYTGNIMAILQRCSTGEQYRVKFLLNEKPFVFNDICDENYLCSLEKLYQLYEAIITSEECSTRFCHHTPEEMCKYLKFNTQECNMLKAQLALLEEKKQKKEEEKQRTIDDAEIKIDGVEEQKEKVIPKELIFLEKEYRHACILICICTVVIIGMFCKMSRVFPRIFRRTKIEPKKEIKKSKPEENNSNVKEGNKNKSKDKNIAKNVEDVKTKTKNKTAKDKTENKKDE